MSSLTDFGFQREAPFFHVLDVRLVRLRMQRAARRARIDTNI
jgi:hypothetical protein